jgi:hypothetical protein
MVSLTQPAVNAREKGTFILRFTRQVGNTDRVVEQLITPHFLTDVADAYGQWDIYEYDLLGNKIINLTESLPRGPAYYDAQPNPVNSDLFIFNTCSDCINQFPDLYQLTKSTGQISPLVSQTPDYSNWWSKDGSRIVNTDEYDPWAQTCGFNLPISGSFSSDGAQLAAGAIRVSSKGHIIILADNKMSRIVDMVNYRVRSVNIGSCVTDLDYLDSTQYQEMNPVYHPSLNKIVFTSDWQGSLDPDFGYMIPYNIYAANDVDGGAVVRLTNAQSNTLGYFDAAWSPDGDKLLTAGQAFVNDYTQIYTVPPSGGTPTPVTKDDGMHYYPKWLRYLGQ